MEQTPLDRCSPAARDTGRGAQIDPAFAEESNPADNFDGLRGARPEVSMQYYMIPEDHDLPEQRA